MSEKDLYREFNGMAFDEHEFDDICSAMTDIQKINLKRKLKKKISRKKTVKYRIAAACIAGLILLVGIGYTNPTLAAQIPVLNPIIKLLGGTGDYARYSDIINKTIACNGKSFTINSVVCYDNNLVIGYTVKSDTKIDVTGPMFFPTFKVNGKWLNVASSGDRQNLNDNTAIGTIEFASYTMALPDKFNFEMSFNSIDDTSGSWDFKFNISRSELGKEMKVYTSNQEVKYGKYNFIIDKVTLTPLRTIVTWHSKSQEQTPSIPIILDDKGNELTWWGGGATFGNGDNYYTTFLPKVDINTKYLAYIPYNDTGDAKSEVVSVPLNTKLPVELSQGKIGKIVVNKISFSDDKDKVVLEGIIYGKLPKLQISALDLRGDNPKSGMVVLNTTIKKTGVDQYEITREYGGLKNYKNLILSTGSLDNTVDYNSRIMVMLK